MGSGSTEQAVLVVECNILQHRLPGRCLAAPARKVLSPASPSCGTATHTSSSWQNEVCQSQCEHSLCLVRELTVCTAAAHLTYTRSRKGDGPVTDTPLLNLFSLKELYIVKHLLTASLSQSMSPPVYLCTACGTIGGLYAMKNLKASDPYASKVCLPYSCM